MTRIAMVAGEPSGDRLGAGLIRALRAQRADLCVEGIGGPQMIEAGCQALYPMERLAVMGIVEVIGRYRELRAMRNRLAEHLLASRPEVFVGIDAPEFNLDLEERLRSAGIRTVHYVSPQVWAWRAGRIRKIARAVDWMLVLFPFEEDYYRAQRVSVRFVGHPLADAIEPRADKRSLRMALGIPTDEIIVALLPGSRSNELRYHLAPFFKAARLLCSARPGMRFVVAAASGEGHRRIEHTRARLVPDLPISIFEHRAREIIGAADVVLTVSGTAALETLLVGRPMVVTYRMSLPSYLVARLLVRACYFSLPNLLAGHRLVPELLQGEVVPERIAAELSEWLDHPEAVAALEQKFSRIRRGLQRGADRRAADLVLDLLERIDRGEVPILGGQAGGRGPNRGRGDRLGDAP